ncbi:MAG: PstS family phosphate ABC transporter substrate-binding protein [Rubrobacteraceae bacterium]
MSRILRARFVVAVSSLLALSFVLAACGGGGGGGEGGGNGGGEASGGGGGGASGTIDIEGSSTVFPITQRVAEAFNQENPDVNITVGDAGSSEGLEAFCNGDIPIADASRPIDPEEEVPTCEENGVDFIEVPVGLDGISVVTNLQNDFAQDITLDELNAIWEPDSQVETWSDVRSDWPDEPISLFGPGTESGTFDFFTEVVTGEEGASRTNYQASGDDNVLVQGVSGDPNALGYFGYSYYAENQDTINALPVDGTEVNPDTISSGEYPLSRPLFIYVSTQALEENEAVEPFVEFYLQDGSLDQFVEESDYVALPGNTGDESRKQFEDRSTGTIYAEDGSLPGGDIEGGLKQSQ